VAASLVVWRAWSSGGTRISAFAGVAGAILASVAVADRTGLSHSVALAIGLVVVGISSSATALDAIENENASWTRHVATFAIAPLAVLAVADASTDAACARWAAAERLPTTDAAVLLSRCETAKLAVAHVDLLHPAVILAGAAGALLSYETHDDETLLTSPVRIAVAIAIAIGLRLAFGTGGAAMAALVAGALLVAQNDTRRRAAHALAALALSLAPLFA
jgi:hypothetical protein